MEIHEDSVTTTDVNESPWISKEQNVYYGRESIYLYTPLYTCQWFVQFS